MTHPSVELAVVGSVALDTIETPVERREGILGGSSSYACAAASFFTRAGMVGIVGTDFTDAHRATFSDLGVDLEGLQVEEGETFRWSGVYEENMNNRRTLSTDLNVFADFSPELPPSYRSAPYILLGNIQPDLQLHVLEQVVSPRFVMADTMDLWINTAKDALDEVIRRVDLVTVNDSEARHYTGEHSLVRAAERLLKLGPGHVLVKKGEHGSLLFSRDGVFVLPAFLLDDVADPTGAGDSFAGAFMGVMAASGGTDEAVMRRALVYANVVAAFGVEAFSLERLSRLTRAEIDERVQAFREMTRVDWEG